MISAAAAARDGDASGPAARTFQPSLPKARRDGLQHLLFAALLACVPVVSEEARRNWPAVAVGALMLVGFAVYRLTAGPRLLAVDALLVDPDGFHAPLIFGRKVPWSRCREVRNLHVVKGGNLLGFAIEGAEEFAPRWRPARRDVVSIRSRPEWRLPIDVFEQDADEVIAAVRRVAPPEITSGLTRAHRW